RVAQGRVALERAAVAGAQGARVDGARRDDERRRRESHDDGEEGLSRHHSSVTNAPPAIMGRISSFTMSTTSRQSARVPSKYSTHSKYWPSGSSSSSKSMRLASMSTAKQRQPCCRP